MHERVSARRRDAPRAEPEPPGPRVSRQLALTPAMLSALGNQAVQRVVTRPLIQRTPKTGDELLNLKVGEFAEHRKTGQMDWANATGLSDKLRNAICR